MVRKGLSDFVEGRIWLIPFFLVLASYCGCHEQKEGKTPPPPSQEEQKGSMSSHLLQEKCSIKMGVGPINALAFSPNNKLLALGGITLEMGKVMGEIKLWDLTLGKETLSFRGHFGEVTALVFSPDGSKLASGSSDGTVRLWDVTADKEIAILKGHSGPIHAVACAPDGKTIASASHDKMIIIWDVEKKAERIRFQGHNAGVWTVTYSPDGKTLASGGFDKTVKLWDTTTGKNTATLEGHGKSIYGLWFGSEGKLLVSGDSGGDIILWDVAQSSRLKKYNLQIGLESIAIARNSKTLVVVGEGFVNQQAIGVLKLVDLYTGQEYATVTGHNKLIHCVTYSSNGAYLATGSWDQTAKVWDVK